MRNTLNFRKKCGCLYVHIYIALFFTVTLRSVRIRTNFMRLEIQVLSFRLKSREGKISGTSRRAVRERLRLKCVKGKVNAASSRLYVYAYTCRDMHIQPDCIQAARS